MQTRLFGMGFCPDARVTVQCADRGSLIVSVGDARYALSRGIAMKILVGEWADWVVTDALNPLLYLAVIGAFGFLACGKELFRGIRAA